MLICAESLKHLESTLGLLGPSLETDTQCNLHYTIPPSLGEPTILFSMIRRWWNWIQWDKVVCPKSNRSSGLAQSLESESWLTPSPLCFPYAPCFSFQSINHFWERHSISLRRASQWRCWSGSNRIPGGAAGENHYSYPSCQLGGYPARRHLLGSRELFKVTNTGCLVLHTVLLMDIKKLIFPQQQSQKCRGGKQSLWSASLAPQLLQ